MKYNDLRLCDYTPGQVGWDPAVATVVLDAVAVSDPPPANQNGDPDPGETASLTVTLRNIGNAPARNVTGHLTSADPLVSVTRPDAFFGDILLTSTGTTDYTVSIALSAPIGHVAVLLLNLAGDAFSAVDTLLLTIAPMRALRVTPSTITNVGSVTVGVGGRHFAAGATVRFERSGFPTITATSTTVVTAESLSAVMPVDGAQTGSWDLVVQNPDYSTSRLVSAINIQSAGPAILAVTPVGGATTDSVGVGLSGLHFNQPVAVWIEMGGTKRYATSLVLVTPDSIHCGLLLRGMPSGTYDVLEQNFDTQTARLAGGFTIWPTPDAQSVTPEVVGTEGVATVVIMGQDFAAGGLAWLSAKNKAPVYANPLQFVSPSDLRATFDLTGVTSGVRTLVVQNPGGGRDSLVNALELVTPPAVHVVRPNGGERLAAGSITTAAWTIQTATNPLDHISVLLSMDGGITYGTAVATAGPLDTFVTWTVPAAMTDSARVRVVAYDIESVSGADESDGLFAIDSLTSAPGLGAADGAPSSLALRVESPQPIRFGTSLRLMLAVPSAAHSGDGSEVVLRLYAAHGALVGEMRPPRLSPGRHRLAMPLRDAGGRDPIGSGVYILRVDVGGRVRDTRVVIVR
jgi:hypothetical protein